MAASRLAINSKMQTNGGAVLSHFQTVIREYLIFIFTPKSKIQNLKSYLPYALCPMRYAIFALLFALCALPLPAANAAQVSLAWNENPEPNITGYQMHYGTTSGNYDHSVDVGNHTSCTISGIKTDRDYYFATTAYNEIGESDFSEEIVYRSSSEPDPLTDPFDEVIIDNGDEGTFFTGIWTISDYSNPYGGDLQYSTDNGSRYSFEAALSGNYVVSLWWIEYSLCCSSVPVEIYDGDALLETIEVNQQTNGGQWNELGEYLFSRTARVVVVSEGGCYTGVDAVEFVSKDLLSSSIYQITSSAGPGGNILPNGEATVSAGSSASYTIQPDANYHIADVKVDGTSVGSVTSYTLKNLDADHTITVSFDADADDTPSIAPPSRRWWWSYFYRWF